MGKTLNLLGTHYQFKTDAIATLRTNDKKDLLYVLELCGYKCKPMTHQERSERINTIKAQKSKQQLLDMAEKYGITTVQQSHTKDQLAIAIVLHEFHHGTEDFEKDFEKLFIKTNFMFPVRKKELTMGILNEPCVLHALPYHISMASRGKFICFFFGCFCFFNQCRGLE